MFTTLVAVISILVLVLPGFVVVDLQRGPLLESALRALWQYPHRSAGT